MRFGIVVLCVLLSLSGFGQKDAELWAGITVEKELTKKAALGLDIESRFNDNASTLDNYFLSPEFKYEFSDFYKVSAGYRFAKWLDVPKHRVQLDQTFTYEKLRHTYYVRIRWQRAFERSELPTDKIRFKAGYRFEPTSDWRFGIAFEQFNEIYNYTNNWLNDQLRFTADVRYSINKSQDISLFYLYEIDQSVSYPEMRYIIGFNYSIDF